MEEDDIRDVMAEEKARGRKRVYTEARKAHQKLLRDVGYLLRLDDRKVFIENLVRLGLKPGSREHEAALQAWNERRGA